MSGSWEILKLHAVVAAHTLRIAALEQRPECPCARLCVPESDATAPSGLRQPGNGQEPHQNAAAVCYYITFSLNYRLSPWQSDLIHEAFGIPAQPDHPTPETAQRVTVLTRLASCRVHDDECCDSVFTDDNGTIVEFDTPVALYRWLVASWVNAAADERRDAYDGWMRRHVVAPTPETPLDKGEHEDTASDSASADVALGRRLASYRGWALLTQRATAARMVDRGYPWTTSTVAEVENGTRSVLATEVASLAAVLQCSVTRLLDV